MALIGHGTKGTDGIEEGIHLRWSFNDKLGFPSCFKLYVRESDTGNLYHFPVEKISLGDLLLPYSIEVTQNEKITYTLESLTRDENDIGFINVEWITMPDGTQLRCLHVTDGKLTVLFSKDVSRIEIAFYLTADSEISVSTRVQGRLSDALGKKGGIENWEILSFDAPGSTGVVIEGKSFRILAIETWRTNTKKGNTWTRINDYCGCGLPVNQTGTPYTDDVYAAMGKDLAMALCRLGYRRIADSPITLAQFLEFKSMLLTMTEEGRSVPVGWTMFPTGAPEGEVSDDTTTQTLEFSKYDFLLTQSLQVYFAKILGLYFVDGDADVNKYYDYKITAEWPAWNKRRLDYQLTFDRYAIDDLLPAIGKLDDTVVLFSPRQPRVVAAINALWRSTNGIEIQSARTPIVLSFLKPVTEVQLVLHNDHVLSGNIIEVEAYRNLFTSYVDKDVLFTESGMVRLRAERIDSIKIIADVVVISRINFDMEMYPVGEQECIISGLIKRNHIPVQPPENMSVSFIPGGTVNNEDGSLTEKPYMAGMRWDANEDARVDLLSIAPVLYHVERKPQGGVAELITTESPLFISPTLQPSADYQPPLGWPSQRQYLTEAIALDQQISYRVAALDLFGRQSDFTPFATYTPTPPKAPHPKNVSAKFLDYGSYNAITQSFSDTTLTKEEKNWLLTNRVNAIAVQWEWPDDAQVHAPDVDTFAIYFKPGWLNNYTGKLSGIIKTGKLAKASLNLTEEERERFPIFDSSPAQLDVYQFKIVLDVDAVPPEPEVPRARTRSRGIEENLFRLCWMIQGNQSFLIVKSNDNANPTLWALKLSGAPTLDKGIGIAIQPHQEFFIDFREPANWPLQLEKTSKTTRVNYNVYCKNPHFPYPAIESNDHRKVRYAQVGVASCVGTITGSVSTPATIMAVHREAPSAPVAFVPTDSEASALLATPANIHGKSSFALRWEKTISPIKYHVLRTLDETLFKKDNSVRATRSDSVYSSFASDHAYFNEADIAVVQNIRHASDIDEVLSQYKSLTPLQLQILASLPDNADAFTRINDQTIDPNDALYADRETEVPDADEPPYHPDENVLLYVDASLNGQSNNYYFYAIKSIDTNALSSELSLSTLPVAVPKTTPPPAPVITSIIGGENQISIKWATNPAIAIEGYLVYRTQSKANSNDWRKMEVIKVNPGDLFTVPALSDQGEFIDTSIISRQPYYYGIVAVGLSYEGKWLKSKMSNVVVGQGYKLSPPIPPLIYSISWIKVNDDGEQYAYDDPSTTLSTAVLLHWETTTESDAYILECKNETEEEFTRCGDWTTSSSFMHVNPYFFLDHEYRIRSKDAYGNLGNAYTIIQLPKK